MEEVKQGAEGAQGRQNRRNAKCAVLLVLVSEGALLYFSLLIKAVVGLLQAEIEGLCYMKRRVNFSGL